MQKIILFSVLALCFACNSSKGRQSKIEDLSGTWLPVRQEYAGAALPAAVYKNQQLIIRDHLYTVIAESTDKGEFSYGGGKMDIYGKDGVNAGKHYTAIYKLENGELTICYNLAGDSYPEGFQTRPATKLFLSVFKKG